MMPGLSGLEVTRQVCQLGLETHIIVLSMHSDEPYVLEAMKNGAAGYVLKGAATDCLLRAVREVAAGRHYLSPPLSEHAIAAYLRQASTAALDRYDSLTTRERQILQLAAQGRTTADITVQLFISPRTVERQHTSLMHKLGLPTQMDLVHYAYRRGLLPPKL
jgi:DNA-binding NarL/FixJ family response regulator